MSDKLMMRAKKNDNLMMTDHVLINYKRKGNYDAETKREMSKFMIC